jgi:hypothetical protein
MRKEPIEAAKHSLGPDSSLTRNFDGEADKYVGCNDADEYTVVDSDEDAGVPYFTQVLFQIKKLL